MRRRNHSTTRPAFLSAFVLAFLLISASNLGAALAAGPIRTQPSRSAPIPPLPVASSAVTLAPRNPVMTATIDQLDALGSSTGLSVAQESELIVAAIGVFNVINRDPTLTRQEQSVFIRETGERLVTIAGTRSRLPCTRTEVAKLFLDRVALVTAAPHQNANGKKMFFELLGQEVLKFLLDASLTDQNLIETLPTFNREIARRIRHLPIRSLAKENLSGLGKTSPTGIRQFQAVIQNEADWKLWWDQLQAHAAPKPDLPQVDFASEMVILVANQVLSSGYVSVQITSVRLATEVGSNEYLVVTFTELYDPPCKGMPSPRYAPFHAVAVPKSNLGVKIEWIIADGVCVSDVIKRNPAP